MQIDEIPRQIISAEMRPEAKELRRNSPQYLASICLPLHEQGVFKGIQNISDIPVEHVSVLGGGIYSACYLVKEQNDDDVVIKFRTQGVESEALWLQKCKKKGVSVPSVKSYSTVPNEEGKKRPVKYIALEAIKGPDGELAKLGYELNTNDLKEISYQMGIELMLIHSVSSDKLFGGYGDMWGAGNVSKTWSEYIKRSLSENDILDFGVPLETRNKAIETISTINFPEHGVYVHGDFGLHNALVKSTHPPEVVIFDPNPIIADPYLDLATQYNRMELKREKYRDHKDNEQYKKSWEREKIYFDNLMTAYIERTGKIDLKRLAANQILKLKESLNYEQAIDMTKIPPEKQEERRIELELKKKFLKDKFEYLASQKNHTSIQQLLEKLTQKIKI